MSLRSRCTRRRRCCRADEAGYERGSKQEVNDALGELTGNLAPARVFLAITLLLITASLFAFNIITAG